MGSHHKQRTNHRETPRDKRCAHQARCRCQGFGDAVRLVAIGLTVAAVVKELRTPAAERTWNGIIAGFVPYDFRVPTCDRIRERVWNPEGEHLVSPHVFGVGWTLNVGKAVALARSAADR
ncbi:MAG: DUF5808 domain-containing protein [Cellulomonas sp.]|nr:DUF5808 domain-containing protein [Cellulomonas sp.]